MGRYRRRNVEGRIAEISAQFPALLVTGPRQVGKTTLLRHAAAKDRRYVSLDDPTLRELAVSDPNLFLERFPTPLLIGYASPATLAAGAMRGAIFETHVVAEVLKSWWHRAQAPPIRFYRDRDGREIDLVFDLDGKLWPVEIKHAATVRREWAGTFSALERLGKPVGPGAVVCLTSEPFPVTREISAVPVGAV